MKRIAVDIETMATTPTAAIVAIAIVIQNNLDPKSRVARVWQISPELAIGDRDYETMIWWRQQSDVAQKVAFGGTSTPQEVCHSINAWLTANLNLLDDCRYYANPARFDFAILNNLFIQCRIKPYIPWRDERCHRTIEKELLDLGVIGPTFVNPCPHDPLADCLTQLDELNFLLSYIEGVVRFNQSGQGGGL